MKVKTTAKSLAQGVKARPEVNSIVGVLRSLGPNQRKLLWFITAGYIMSPFGNMGVVFYAAKINYWCKRPPGYENSTLQTCHSYENHAEKCHKWEYDNSFYKSNMISEWDLVCDRAWLASASQSCSQIGIAFAAIIFGYISDKFGRLLALKIAFFIEICAGFSEALSLSMTQFMFSAVVLGFASYGRYLSGFLLMLEWIEENIRSEMSIIMEAGWVVGYMLIPIISYYVRHFRYIILTMAVYELLCFIWLMIYGLPESPKWLATQNKQKQAQDEDDSDVSEFELEMGDDMCLINAKKKVEKAQNQSLWELWGEAGFVTYTLVLYFSWFTIAFVSYGISLNIQDLGGDLFVNFVISGFAEVLAKMILLYTLAFYGRKTLLFVFLTVGGLAFMAMIPFSFNDQGLYYRVAFSFVGRLCISCCFHIIYLYSAELFPTSLRQVAVGTCSLSGRVGSVLAPFVKELSHWSHLWVSMFIFGALSLVNGILILLLPETRGKEIPDTISDTRENADFKR